MLHGAGSDENHYMDMNDKQIIRLAEQHGYAVASMTTADEVVKYLLVGADVVMTTSALLRHGVSYVQSLLAGLTDWLSAREFVSLEKVRGMLSHNRANHPEVFERANYIKILQGYEPSPLPHNHTGSPTLRPLREAEQSK
jgi:hypothetical protein